MTDAERYQWLRRHWDRVVTTVDYRDGYTRKVVTCVELLEPHPLAFDADSLDRAIDAAALRALAVCPIVDPVTRCDSADAANCHNASAHMLCPCRCHSAAAVLRGPIEAAGVPAPAAKT